MNQNVSRVYEVDIYTTPERVWKSLTDPELTQQYYFNTRVESDWQLESTIHYRDLKGVRRRDT
jgi:uncharacterized protein YndB with AHSA1/START domain